MAFFGEQIVGTDGALAFEKAHDVSHGEFGWNFEEHMDVIGAGCRFEDFHFFLRGKLAEDFSNLRSRVSVENLFAVLWYNDHVILAVPDHVTLRCKGAHGEWRECSFGALPRSS